MNLAGVEGWAQAGVEREEGGNLAADALAVSWDLDTASAFIRAAYGKGYAHALSDPDPLLVEEARERAAALLLPL